MLSSYLITLVYFSTISGYYKGYIVKSNYKLVTGNERREIIEIIYDIPFS